MNTERELPSSMKVTNTNGHGAGIRTAAANSGVSGVLGRGDIQAKLAEIRDRSTEQARDARDIAVVTVAVGAVVLVVGAYLAGRRRGRRRRTIVEITRG